MSASHPASLLGGCVQSALCRFWGLNDTRKCNEGEHTHSTDPPPAARRGARSDSEKPCSSPKGTWSVAKSQSPLCPWIGAALTPQFRLGVGAESASWHARTTQSTISPPVLPPSSNTDFKERVRTHRRRDQQHRADPPPSSSSTWSHRPTNLKPTTRAARQPCSTAPGRRPAAAAWRWRRRRRSSSSSRGGSSSRRPTTWPRR